MFSWRPWSLWSAVPMQLHAFTSAVNVRGVKHLWSILAVHAAEIMLRYEHFRVWMCSFFKLVGGLSDRPTVSLQDPANRKLPPFPPQQSRNICSLFWDPGTRWITPTQTSRTVQWRKASRGKCAVKTSCRVTHRQYFRWICRKLSFVTFEFQTFSVLVSCSDPELELRPVEKVVVNGENQELNPTEGWTVEGRILRGA